MAAPGERGLLLGGAQRGATHKMCTSRWFHKVQVTPAPFVKPPLSQPCILVIIIISTLTVSIMGSIIWMLLSSSALQHEHYRLGMDTVIIECVRTRTEVSLGHGCSQHRVHLNTNVLLAWAWMLSSLSAIENNRGYGSDMDALKIKCIRTRLLLWFGHGCWLSSSSVLKNDRYYGSGMGALVNVCSWNANIIMVWTWMLSSSMHSNTNVIMVWTWMLW